ncbi:phage portal protein [Zooshikella ganghwensis]|uniref:Phage portal protein n=1 Tax=Zooshikella ganghwensis TaxID=202772 RepID=A0A4P9VF60_9GAMM|nr:phage portal protein [Zooshikella ganghwensis]RDH41603.1 phage portal protein [Zooshikella ganghwensis]RDH41693.1 phage portal protein [Zooshikella ganghwensis]
MAKKNKSKKRQAVKNETVTLDNIERLSDLLGIHQSAAGVSVTKSTAMCVSAVYACVRLISGAIATLPFEVFRKEGSSRKKDASHSLYGILRKQPNPKVSSVVFWETACTHILLQGNSYAIIHRNRQGDPLALTIIDPSRVEVDVKNDRLLYFITLEDGQYLPFDMDDILHIPGIGWNGRKGLSVISSVGQNSIGCAIAADEYAGRFFSNDATPRGYLSYPNKISADQADEIRNYWFKKHQGLENKHLPAVITGGGEFKETTLSPQDSQIIQTRKFQVCDIARIFGVPPHLVGETEKSTSWGTGIEQQSIGFVQYTLRPHLTRIEQEVNRKLFRSDSFFAEFNVNGLLRGDIKGRNEAYRIALGGNQEPGWMTVNEVRKLDNLPPIEGGDILYRPATGENNAKKQAT